MLNPYEIIEFKSAKDFLQNCEELLLGNESFHNLKLGLATLIKENGLETSEPLFFGIYNNDQILGCALRTNLDKPSALMIKNIVDS